MPSKYEKRTAGLPNLVNPNAHDRVSRINGALRQAPGQREFWRPVFSMFPGRRIGNFIRSTFGFQAIGPINASSSYGGITVTPEVSLMLSAVWSCIGRYQKTISTLPLQLMRQTGRNSAERFSKHPLYRVLHDQPNSQMSAAIFWQQFIGQQMTWGAAYAVKLKAPDGRIVGLKPLLSAYMTTYLDEQERLRYFYSPGGGTNTDRDYAADELFVVMDRTMDGYAPLSRIQYAANSLGVAIAADRAANLTFRNGLRASGILTVGAWLKENQRKAYRDKINEFVGTGNGDSSDKQYGVFVAENATKFEPINLNPVDLELLSSRKFSIEDVCRWYDTPPILIGHATEGQTMWGTGVEQIILGWLKLGLAPVLRTTEQEIWRQLLTPAEQGEGIFSEYNLEALLRGDSQARAAFWSQMLQNGVYTRQEARERESLPEIADSNQLTVQSNLVPLDQLGQNQPNDAQQVRNALRSFLGLEESRGEPKAKDA
jgi:HK97 family phage portal protein